MTATDIFMQLRCLVDEACRVDSFHVAIEGAKALDMTGGRIEKGIFTLDYEFKISDQSGASVVLQFHSYDQSRAFDVQPDMNRFEVTLTHISGLIETHKNEYEG